MWEGPLEPAEPASTEPQKEPVKTTRMLRPQEMRFAGQMLTFILALVVVVGSLGRYYYEELTAPPPSPWD